MSGVKTGVQVVTVLPCRFMDANGNGSREQAIKCMDWCLKREAHVLSNSWGEVPNSLSLQVSRAIYSLKPSPHPPGPPPTPRHFSNPHSFPFPFLLSPYP